VNVGLTVGSSVGFNVVGDGVGTSPTEGKGVSGMGAGVGDGVAGTGAGVVRIGAGVNGTGAGVLGAGGVGLGVRLGVGGGKED